MRNKKLVRRFRTANDLPPDLNPFKPRNYHNRGLSDFSQEYDFERSGIEIEMPEDLPIDLHRRKVTERPGGSAAALAQQGIDKDELIARILYNTDILASVNVLDRGLIGRSVTIGTTPTRIIQSQFLRGYIVMNPSLIVGGTAVGTLLASTTTSVAGNTQSDPLGVANYRDLHLFLDVTSATGTLDIYAQALDPVTLNWADTQLLYSGIAATGTYYANPGSLGLATDLALRWEITGGPFTFSIGYALKEGLPGTGAGVGKTLYLGNSGVTIESGFPLLEGQSRPFYLKENTELWAVANTSLDLRVFEL